MCIWHPTPQVGPEDGALLGILGSEVTLQAPWSPRLHSSGMETLGLQQLQQVCEGRLPHSGLTGVLQARHTGLSKG